MIIYAYLFFKCTAKFSKHFLKIKQWLFKMLKPIRLYQSYKQMSYEIIYYLNNCNKYITLKHKNVLAKKKIIYCPYKYIYY